MLLPYASLTSEHGIPCKCALFVLLFLIGFSLASCRGWGEGGADLESEEISMITLREAFRVGDDSAGDTIFFGDISGMAVNSSGQLFVGDTQDKMVSVFSAQGERVGKIGREGGGPGEFGDLRDVVLDQSDSIYVFDDTRTRSQFLILRLGSSGTWSQWKQTILWGI